MFNARAFRHAVPVLTGLALLLTASAPAHASAGPSTRFITIDDPLSVHGTSAFGIDPRGVVVGQYVDAAGTARHGLNQWFPTCYTRQGSG